MMFDDDIQFLGFNNTARPRALLPPLKSVTGFTLHVEKNGSESAARMIFGKANANIVVVGRKPPQASAGFDSDRSKAMFRCPVVSRAHAKFTFSDSGFLYVTDTSSHHGTHIQRPTDLTPKAIPAELLVQVHDGDVVTFGKSVGRNNEIVRPVVARVELIYSNSSPKIHTTEKPTSSGRYGLHFSDTSEGDSSSENSNDSALSYSDHSSDRESDIVEVSPPPNISLPVIVPSYKSALRTLALPMFNPNAHRDPLSLPSLSATTSKSDTNNSGVNKDTDEVVHGSDAYSNDIFDFGSPTSSYPAKVISNEDLPDHPHTRRNLPALKKRLILSTSIEPVRLDGAPQRKSRSVSSSPMDLATPSPSCSSPKIAEDIETRSTPISSLVDEDQRKGTHQQFWSPLSSPPPLPSPPSPWLTRLINLAQSPSQSAPAEDTCPGKEESVQPLFSLARMNESAHSLSPFHPASSCPMEAEQVLSSPSLPKCIDESAQSPSHSTSNITNKCSEIEGSPFAGHAEEEDISNESPHDIPDVSPFPSDMDHHKDVHNSRGSDNAEANIDIEVRSSQEGWLPFEGATVQDEVRLAIDEHVFNEVHQDHSTRREIDNKEPDSTPIGAQALSATSSPVASVLQRAGAALSSFKERFSGPIMEAATGPDQTASTGIVGSGVHDSCEIKTKEIGKELFSMKDDITNLQLRYRKYRTRFNANVATMNTKLAQLNSLSSSVSHTKDCLDGLDANFTTAKVDIDCMKGDIDEIRIDVDGMRGDIDQVQYQTDESRMEINGIQNDVQDIRGQVDTILSDVGGVRDDYDIVHEDVTWFQREVSEMRANIEGMRMDLDMRGVERIEQSIDNVREEFRNLRQEWSNWKEEANVDAQIARARTQSTVEVACAGGKDAQLREMAEELLELQKKSDAELTALEAARSQAEHELRIIVALRQEVEHAVSIRVREESTNPQSVMVRSSLKRKYANDSEDIGEVPEASKKMGAHIGAHSAYANDTNRTTSLNADGIFIPSSKRARKLARARRVGIVVVQTATVATVGAVAAWAALAFT